MRSNLLPPCHYSKVSLSSLVTGSRSHKAVTSDVSRILSTYYNPVSLSSLCHVLHRLTQFAENAVRVLRWERTVFRCAVLDEMGPFSHWTGLPWNLDLGAAPGHRHTPFLRHKEYHQCCAALESVEDSGWCGSCGEREIKRGSGGIEE